MRKLIVALVCFQFVLSVSTAQTTKPTKGIIGIWQLVEFADYDSVSKTWMHRYGKTPRGYFIYSPGGILSINVSNDKPLKITEEEAKNYTINFHEFFSSHSFGYFGTYTYEPAKGQVIHHVKGGTLPFYTDTEQPRQIQLKGDTAIIGDNIRTRRVLVRVE
jgi:Lipocalin-like domain